MLRAYELMLLQLLTGSVLLDVSRLSGVDGCRHSHYLILLKQSSTTPFFQFLANWWFVAGRQGILKYPSQMYTWIES